LRNLLAEHHQMAGWAAFDAGHQEQARAHYLDSLRAARQANNAALAGNALAFLAYQETATHQDGTATANASHDIARSVATPRVDALLLERKAFAHAVAGNAQQADLALGQAYEALHRDDDRPEPDWVFWVDERELGIMTGRCWTELSRPLRAVPVLEAVLADFDDTHGRDKALYLTWLASSYLQAHEVEHAAATLAQAHRLAAGVASARPTARIARIAKKLSRYQHVPEVSAALEQLAT
jgi:tetratricopeptide (TPR) repeat protein